MNGTTIVILSRSSAYRTLPRRKSGLILLLLVAMCCIVLSFEAARAQIVPSSQVCESRRNAGLQKIQAARQALQSCDAGLEYYSGNPDYYGQSVCSAVYVASRRCISQGRALCSVIKARDNGFADCQAGARVHELMNGVSRFKDLKGIDQALGSVRPSNNARGRISPADELSSDLSTIAYERLENSTRNMLENFDRAFDRWERSDKDRSFIQQQRGENRFIPFGENRKEMAGEIEISEEADELLSLADAVAEKDYDMTFGNAFTSNEENVEAFGEATEAALDGDLSPMANFSDWDPRFEATGDSVGSGTSVGDQMAERAQEVLKDLIRQEVDDRMAENERKERVEQANAALKNAWAQQSRSACFNVCTARSGLWSNFSNRQKWDNACRRGCRERQTEGSSGDDRFSFDYCMSRIREFHRRLGESSHYQTDANDCRNFAGRFRTKSAGYRYCTSSRTLGGYNWRLFCNVVFR